MQTDRLSCRGFTLLELMLSIAIIGITMTWYVKAHVESERFAEAEAGLQTAIRALRNEVEILRVMPCENFESGTRPFDAQELDNLVEGRGIVTIETESGASDLFILRVEVHWRCAKKGTRSIHTVLVRSANPGGHRL